MSREDVTRLLVAIENGHRDAFDELMVRVYPDLHEIAHARMREQWRNHTLNTTGLVHEAYLKLVRYPDVKWQGRSHFFGAAAQTMRRILIDYARGKTAQKRKADEINLTQAGELSSDDISLDQLIAIDDALQRLAEERPRWVRVVECRYFAGMTIEETAETLGVSHATVSNDWQMARAWLKREFS